MRAVGYNEASRQVFTLVGDASGVCPSAGILSGGSHRGGIGDGADRRHRWLTVQTTTLSHATVTGIPRDRSSTPTPENFAAAMATTRPRASITGPPLLPGLMAAVN